MAQLGIAFGWVALSPAEENTVVVQPLSDEQRSSFRTFMKLAIQAVQDRGTARNMSGALLISAETWAQVLIGVFGPAVSEIRGESRVRYTHEIGCPQ